MEEKQPTKCVNEAQHVSYPHHEIGDDGQCQFCGAWFAVGDDDEWDESVEYPTRDARDEAVW